MCQTILDGKVPEPASSAQDNDVPPFLDVGIQDRFVGYHSGANHGPLDAGIYIQAVLQGTSHLARRTAESYRLRGVNGLLIGTVLFMSGKTVVAFVADST
jgi:hypothetical protein